MTKIYNTLSGKVDEFKPTFKPLFPFPLYREASLLQEF